MSESILMTAPGGPEVLQLTEVVTAAPAAGEVQIRHSVIGVNFIDLYLRSGLYPVPALPAVLGLEGAARVEAVGAGVSSVQVGDRVAYAGMPLGAYSTVRNIPAGRLIRLPDDVADEVAGSSMLRGLTAHMLLKKVHPVAPGDWILVHAAAGGLGQLLVRWGKRLGARVIGTVGSEAKRQWAFQAGADAVLLHNDPHWPAAARQIADTKGVHLAVDGIGGARLLETIGCVRPFGSVASVGQAAGGIPAVDVEELGPVRSIALVRPSVIAYSNDPSLYRQGATELMQVLAAGPPSPIGATYSLREAAKAHADLGAGRTMGSVVLTV